METQLARKATILLIEDNGDSREMMKLLLESLTYRVLTAANGHQALTLAGSNYVDLILTDFELPDMDGVSIVRRLRTLNEDLRRAPIIMLTALEGDEYYNAAISAGCTDFLPKPLDFETLQTMIEKLLREKRKQPEELRPDRLRNTEGKMRKQRLNPDWRDRPKFTAISGRG